MTVGGGGGGEEEAPSLSFARPSDSRGEGRKIECLAKGNRVCSGAAETAALRAHERRL